MLVIPSGMAVRTQDHPSWGTSRAHALHFPGRTADKKPWRPGVTYSPKGCLLGVVKTQWRGERVQPGFCRASVGFELRVVHVKEREDVECRMEVGGSLEVKTVQVPGPGRCGNSPRAHRWLGQIAGESPYFGSGPGILQHTILGQPWVVLLTPVLFLVESACLSLRAQLRAHFLHKVLDPSTYILCSVEVCFSTGATCLHSVCMASKPLWTGVWKVLCGLGGGETAPLDVSQRELSLHLLVCTSRGRGGNGVPLIRRVCSLLGDSFREYV